MIDSSARYLAAVRQRLEEAGYSCSSGPRPGLPSCLLIARRTAFEWTKSGFVEKVFVFGRFSSLDGADFREFEATCFDYSLKSRKVPFTYGFFQSHFCFPVVIVDGLDPETAEAVRRDTPPLHFAAGVVPAAYELRSQALYYFEGTPLWGALYYAGFRKTIRRFLGPPSPDPAGAVGLDATLNVEEANRQVSEVRAMRSRGLLSSREAFERHQAVLSAGPWASALPPPPRPAFGRQAPEPAVPEVREVIRAGFGDRLAAYLIDLPLRSLLIVPAILLIPDKAVQVLLAFLLALIYDTFFWTLIGATPGKMLRHLKVLDAGTLQLVSFDVAVLRFVCAGVSGLALGLGYLWVLWDPRQEAWHDKLAGTAVISTR